MVDPVYKMWGLSECPFCVKAKEVFIENNLQHEVVILDNYRQRLDEAKEKYKWKTVPIIVKSVGNIEVLIGGYTDLIEHLESNLEDE